MILSRYLLQPTAAPSGLNVCNPNINLCHSTVLKLTWQGSSRIETAETTLNKILQRYSAKEAPKADRSTTIPTCNSASDIYHFNLKKDGQIQPANQLRMSTLQEEDQIQPLNQPRMSTTQEEDRIQPADKLQKPSPQVDGLSQPQAAYPMYLPPDALPKPEPVPVPIRDPVYVTPLERLGELPADIDCPFCHRRTRTRLEHEDSNWTGIAMILCCLTTGICFFIPYCCGWCQDTNHYCSECNKKVTHKPYDDDRVHVVLSPLRDKVPSIYPVEQVSKGT